MIGPSQSLRLLLLVAFLALSQARPIPQHGSKQELPPIARRLKAHIQKTKDWRTTMRQTTSPYNCDGTRVRREIRTLSDEDRADWAAALIELRDTPSEFENITEWNALVLIHVIFSDEAHGGSYFLPWHRLFLLRLENVIRRTRPSFTLPYWNWSLDAADAALSPVWGPGYVGGAVAGPSAIPDGPFANSEARYPVEHTVGRNFDSGVSGAIPVIYDDARLQQVIEVVTDWGRFSDAVEAAHDLPHVYIGGDMFLTAFSPNDPIFYLHHAFVDSLWTRRQLFSGNPSEFGGTHDFMQGEGTVFASATFEFEAYELTPQDVFALNCVQYAPFPALTSLIEVVEEDPEDVCENELFVEAAELTPNRCARAERVLRRSSANVTSEM